MFFLTAYHKDSKVREMVTATGDDSIFANRGSTAICYPVLSNEIP